MSPNQFGQAITKIILLGAACFIAFVLGPSQWNKLRQSNALINDGRQTEAIVDYKHSESWRSQETYNVVYGYWVNGQNFQTQTQVGVGDYASMFGGKHIVITYLPENPSVTSVNPRSDATRAKIGVLAVAFLTGACVFAALVKKRPPRATSLRAN